MTQMFKHVGKIINTDARCIVAWMQIPGAEDHALIINCDTLPPHFEQTLRKTLESPEGQASANFGDILGRRLMSVSGVRIIDALHNAGLLTKVHIDNVVMTPLPGMAFPLRQVIASLKGQDATPPAQDFNQPVERFNPHTHNQNLRSIDERVNIARTLLMEASELTRVASAKTQKAYEMAPELSPAVPSNKGWVPEHMAIVDDNFDVASPLMEVDPPSETSILVETETASMATIEAYAAQMMGEAPPATAAAPKPTKKAAATKTPTKTTTKMKTKKVG